MAFSGEDLVLRNDKGNVMNACSGEKQMHPSIILHNITCQNHDENGISLEAESGYCSVCTVSILVTLTDNSKTGIYFLELQETAGQFWIGTIFFSRFQSYLHQYFSEGI